MKFFFLALFIAACPLASTGQSSSQKTPLPPHPNGTGLTGNRDGNDSRAWPNAQSSNRPSRHGGLSRVRTGEGSDAQSLACRVPFERSADASASGKMEDVAGHRQSLSQSLDSLRQSMAAQEDWRRQFEARPDSLYLGFQILSGHQRGAAACGRRGAQRFAVTRIPASARNTASRPTSFSICSSRLSPTWHIC